MVVHGILKSTNFHWTVTMKSCSFLISLNNKFNESNRHWIRKKKNCTVVNIFDMFWLCVAFYKPKPVHHRHKESLYLFVTNLCELQRSKRSLTIITISTVN